MSGGRREPSVRFREPSENPAIVGNGGRRQPGSSPATSPMALGERLPVSNSPRVYSYPGLAKKSPGGNGSRPEGFSWKRPFTRKINTEKVLPFVAVLSVATALYMFLRCGCAIEEPYPAKRSDDLREPPTNVYFEHIQAPEGSSTESIRLDELSTDTLGIPGKESNKGLDERPQSKTAKVGMETVKHEPLEEPEEKENEVEQVSIEAAFQDGTDVSRSLFRDRTLYPASDVTAKDVLGSSYARRVIVSTKSKLVFCPIPSTASTNWKVLMRKLEGFPDYLDIQKARSRTGSGLRYLSELSAQEVDEILADGSFVTFTFVRHPVHRMLATYINKLTKEPQESEEYRIYMGQLYGRDYIEKNDVTKARRPSFDEFIDRLAVADENIQHENWSSQTSLCGLGSFPYDFVGRFENLEHDAALLLRATNHASERFLTIRELGIESSHEEDLASTLFSENTVQKLASKQQSDFTLLNYDMRSLEEKTVTP
eukprot:CAMPEP_0184742264 /NCGR_PEP_ID=MMETSP0315-20130426/5245_1 /TAXON_ID=101924 /ORGANISM="Rhodosorus marinus, Strain UTEX LB 2760" /LENGTH=483 /DNA_ID=CAMNT_0027213015 /DNA_START=211 /DNA_END=1662 /DNA_ORIENTATION=+